MIIKEAENAFNRSDVFRSGDGEYSSGNNGSFSEGRPGFPGDASENDSGALLWLKRLQRKGRMRQQNRCQRVRRGERPPKPKVGVGVHKNPPRGLGAVGNRSKENGILGI